MKQATVSDVAREAGVSTATVSRVLNLPGQVAESTRLRVEEAIAALQYVPNVAARNFKARRAENLLVIAEHIGNLFFSEVFIGLQGRAEAEGYHIIITTPPPEGASEMILNYLRSGRVDGVVVLSGPGPSDEALAQLNDLYGNRPPLVGFGEAPGALAYAHVLIDNEVGGYLATRHLAALGHRRIGHVTGPPGTVATKARRAGYRRALAEAGLPHAAELEFPGGFNPHHGKAGAEFFMALPQPPTAAFCANDECAMGFVHALAALGVRVPDDVSVVGYDDTMPAENYVPALTCVHQPRGEIGREAMNLLLRLIDGTAPEGTQCLELPLSLVARQSVRPL